MPGETRFGIIANPQKSGAAELLHRLVARLQSRARSVLLEETSAAFAGLPGGIPLDELSKRVDILVVLGGDGTLLWVVRKLQAAPVPIAVINSGTLGFLTCATEEEGEDLADALVSSHFSVSERLLLAGDVEAAGQPRKTFYALNEATLCRAAGSGLVGVEAKVDGVFANRYTGDGLILSTPTGSTAHSLSAGGPLVAPDASVFVLTPIGPHALSNRPLVIDSASLVTLETRPQRNDVSLLVDGHPLALLDGRASVSLRRADFPLRLISLPPQEFYGVLHGKMGWTGSSGQARGARGR